MAFNREAALAAKMIRRTEAVSVPELAGWFEPGEEPVWTVRGLTAAEIHRSAEAGNATKVSEALVDAIADADGGKIGKALKQQLGLDSKKVPPSLSRFNMVLRSGCVEPECDQSLAVWLSEHYPLVHDRLYQAINRLTGHGSDAEKKPGDSGATPPSGEP